MVKSHIIEILKTFSPKEIKDFGDFVRSPYYNKNESVVTLYTYLRKYYPEFPEEKILKEEVHKKIFKGAYNDGFMRKVMFNLQNLLEEYLPDAFIKNDRVQKSIYLLFELEKRNQLKLLKKKTKETEEMAKNAPYIPGDPHMKQHDIEYVKDMINTREFSVKKSADYINKIQKRPEYTIKSFLIRILTNYSFLLNQKYIIDFEPKLEFFDEISNFLENNSNYLEDMLVNIKYRSVMLLKNMDKPSYSALKKVFLDNFDNIGRVDRYNVSVILSNYNDIMRVRGVEGNFLDELLELYELTVKHKLYALHEGMHHHPVSFMNIVYLTTENDRIPWLKNYIAEYSSRLHPDLRDDYVCYANARILFFEGNHEKALAALAMTKNLKHPDIMLSMRNFQLITFYELGMTENAFMAIDSYRHFIKKDLLLTPARKIIYKNFIKAYNGLLQLQVNPIAENIMKFKDELKEIGYLDEISWFNKKISELECKIK